MTDIVEEFFCRLLQIFIFCLGEVESITNCYLQPVWLLCHLFCSSAMIFWCLICSLIFEVKVWYMVGRHVIDLYYYYYYYHRPHHFSPCLDHQYWPKNIDLKRAQLISNFPFPDFCSYWYNNLIEFWRFHKEFPWIDRLKEIFRDGQK